MTAPASRASRLRRWARATSRPPVPGYAAVTVSLKAHRRAARRRHRGADGRVADLADRYSFGEMRVTTSRTWCSPTSSSATARAVGG
jgi:sulfite reductase (NADPH) hemoprotein beta-component